jgi:4-hydroxyphenylpyruvate dioxygenase
MTTSQAAPEAPVTDTFPINGTDFVEFWVGNARQSVAYYQYCWGYKLIAYRGPETGTRDSRELRLEQGKIRFVLTSALGPKVRSPSTLRGMAMVFATSRSGSTIAATPSPRRSRAVPRRFRNDGPRRRSWQGRDRLDPHLRRYGAFDRRAEGYRGIFLPGFVPASNTVQPPNVGLQYVDHCVGNVELGKMNDWVAFYRDVLGFTQLVSFDDKDISTEYSALMSKVMANGISGSSSPSTSRRRAARRARSTSTSSTIAAPACSTSPSPPTTSSRR